MARRLDIARRAELAAKAVSVLKVRGVQRCTMSDLAQALGIKRPTLYFYFRDLGAVFDVVFEDTQRRYLEHVARRLENIDHPIDQMIALVRATAEFQTGQRDLVVLLFQLWAVGGSDPEKVLSRGRELLEPTRQLLIGRLAAGIAAGQVTACDPPRLVDLVLATMDGAMVAQVTRRAAPTAIAEELIARVLEPVALRPRGRARPSATRTVRSPR
jgi:AcrR family transcriptional regulator